MVELVIQLVLLDHTPIQQVNHVWPVLLLVPLVHQVLYVKPALQATLYKIIFVCWCVLWVLQLIKFVFLAMLIVQLVMLILEFVLFVTQTIFYIIIVVSLHALLTN